MLFFVTDPIFRPSHGAKLFPHCREEGISSIFMPDFSSSYITLQDIVVSVEVTPCVTLFDDEEEQDEDELELTDDDEEHALDFSSSCSFIKSLSSLWTSLRVLSAKLLLGFDSMALTKYFLASARLFLSLKISPKPAKEFARFGCNWMALR